jgi:hypothetical protein
MLVGSGEKPHAVLRFWDIGRGNLAYKPATEALP